MQGIDANEARTDRGEPADHLDKVGEITHAPVALRTQRVQLHGHAPEAPAGGDIRRLVAFLWRDDDPAARHGPCIDRHIQIVIAERQVDRHIEAAPADPLAIGLAAPLLGTRGAGDRTLVTGAIFPAECPSQRASNFRAAQQQIDPYAMAGRRRDQRHEAPWRNRGCTDAVHGPQDPGFCLPAEIMQLPAKIMISIADAAKSRQLVD